MKKLIYSLFAFAMVACSGPKYTASFNNVNSTVLYYATQTETPTPVNPQELVASNAETPVIFATTIEPVAEPVRKTYMQMTKAERKDLRQYLRAEIKSAANAKKMNSKMGVEAAHATKAMDHDLKLAAIFGAAGLVAMAIFAGNSVLWVVGGIALIIGVVFFVKWLVRQ
ncbi:MAG TPA: hypothetical protein DHV26_01540 [Cytophagales bacterium]|nr:hypothetical protein [Cytophagales bacterium]